MEEPERLTALVAGLTETRVVLFGSLPPHGRDLDLLARPDATMELEEGLAKAGFERRGRMWARFRGCEADVVEVAPAASWGLPTIELTGLFDEAAPIEPSGSLCRPAPHHGLLILARRAMREGARVKQARRERVADELHRDPAAFERARERAAAWGAVKALAALEAAYRRGDPIGRGVRRRAVEEQLKGTRGRFGALVGSWRAVLRRPRRGDVIAFSGLDGCGKSTQVEALVGTLDRLGLRPASAWTSIAFHPPWLGRGARALKRGLGRLPASGQAPAAAPGAPSDPDPGKALRARSRLLTFSWSMLLSAVLALQVARRIWPPLLRGETVVCDRYLLDAWAHMAYQYGERRRYAAQLALLRVVFPRPARAFLLEVSPEVAAGRKPEFSAEQNARRAGLYRERAAVLDVAVLDGSRPLEVLCEEVAREAWAALA